jgi:hypothetical protein
MKTPLTKVTMSKPIEEILTLKPEARPRIYAYSIYDEAHKGLLKIGQTTRDVKQRVAEQVKTAAIKNYKIELDESAERDDGTIFSDHDVRAALIRKKFAKTELEWVRCTVKDVKTVLTQLRTGQQGAGTGLEAASIACVRKLVAWQSRRDVQRRGSDGLIYFLKFDHMGRLWAGTEHGVGRLGWAPAGATTT